MAGLRNRIDFNQQRAQELNELIDRYESDIAAAEKKQTEQESQIQEADALIARINQLLQTKENEVEQHVEILENARTARVQTEDELQTLQLALSKHENRIATFQNDLTGVSARRDATLARITELSHVITEQARHVSALFTRVLSAGRKLKDMSSREETPELPEDPEALSFLVCAYLEIPNEERLEMLELRDTAERLRQAQELLEQAAVEFEKKATLAELSRKNGHGGKFELPGQAE